MPTLGDVLPPPDGEASIVKVYSFNGAKLACTFLSPSMSTVVDALCELFTSPVQPVNLYPAAGTASIDMVSQDSY